MTMKAVRTTLNTVHTKSGTYLCLRYFTPPIILYSEVIECVVLVKNTLDCSLGPRPKPQRGSLPTSRTGQGVVTPISIVLRAATGIVTPYTADVGVAYRNTPYTTEKSRSHGGFLRRSQGHRQFSSAVTRSQAVFGRSQIVTPVAALSTAHIGVTTPCWIISVDRSQHHVLENQRGSLPTSRTG